MNEKILTYFIYFCKKCLFIHQNKNIIINFLNLIRLCILDIIFFILIIDAWFIKIMFTWQSTRYIPNLKVQ